MSLNELVQLCMKYHVLSARRCLTCKTRYSRVRRRRGSSGINFSLFFPQPSHPYSKLHVYSFNKVFPPSPFHPHSSSINIQRTCAKGGELTSSPANDHTNTCLLTRQHFCQHIVFFLSCSFFIVLDYYCNDVSHNQSVFGAFIKNFVKVKVLQLQAPRLFQPHLLFKYLRFSELPPYSKLLVYFGLEINYSDGLSITGIQT